MLRNQSINQSINQSTNLTFGPGNKQLLQGPQRRGTVKRT